MRNLLTRASRSILDRLARERTLCAFDFDGTLSPISDHPHQAQMRGGTRNLLGRLALLYPCVIVSGRSRPDLLSRLEGTNVTHAIGNHGAETERTWRKSHGLVHQWTTALERELGFLPGLWVENKGLSVAVHYRHCPRKAEAHQRILEVARNLEQACVCGGKQVVNLLPAGSPHKGDALAAERSRLECKWVLYVGDDENDESAFALEGKVVPVRIGRKRLSRARYYLRSQAEIDELLNLLCLLRCD